MATNVDPEGFGTRVTFLGKGWGVQVLRGGRVIDSDFVKSKDLIGPALAAMLRLIDKCGNPSSMASASRARQGHKLAKLKASKESQCPDDRKPRRS